MQTSSLRTGLRGNHEGKSLAVIIHLFHSDMWPAICERLKTINEPYDIYMSVREQDKNRVFPAPSANVRITTFPLPNRGRDVLPFLFVLRRVRALGYVYILKLHTKKSSWREDGAVWFDELLQGLLPSPKTVQDICGALEQGRVSLIGPSEHIVSLKRHMGSNQPILENLLHRTYGEKIAEDILAHAEAYPFVGGTMFWVRCDLLDPLLDLQLAPG
jgi:lipopolysaccharide biosynthesis protein